MSDDNNERYMNWPTAFAEAAPWICVAAILIAGAIFSG